jgi:ubiquinone/menaquinone biosynthesis C-methylase UbiE
MTVNIEYILADIQNLEIFPAESFDKILAIDVLEHLSNPQLEAVLVEVRRILKKDGVLAFFTPCRSHWIECLKDKNIVLKQFEEHIGVRTEKEYRQVVAGLDLKVKSVLRYETCLPILRSFDRILKTIPVAGNLFVSRIAMAVSK